MGNIGPTEILVIVGVCGACLLPLAVGAIAVLIVVLARK
jgi:hypothetical protein